jgi:hypothetical protein
MGRMTAALAKKLGVKSGATVVLIGAPEGTADLLQPLPEGATLAGRAVRGGADVVVLFARDLEALDSSVPASVRATKPGGLLWVAYPKGGAKAGTDLNRDILHAHMARQDLIGVTLVAVDPTWSAMRFRPGAEVGR